MSKIDMKPRLIVEDFAMDFKAYRFIVEAEGLDSRLVRSCKFTSKTLQITFYEISDTKGDTLLRKWLNKLPNKISIVMLDADGTRLLTEELSDIKLHDYEYSLSYDNSQYICPVVDFTYENRRVIKFRPDDKPKIRTRILSKKTK
jgi:hypothetical protein